MSLGTAIYGQFFRHPPYPTASFAGKTVVVTGANVGLGFEACKHFSRLGAARIIAGVRTVSKGEDAKKTIEAATNRVGVIEVWPVDYSSYSSVQDFGARVAALDRVDSVVLNAGIATEDFEIFEDNESTITVNVISTALLVLLVLPGLRRVAQKHGIEPSIAIVSSDIHAYTSFPERKEPDILQALADKTKARMGDRYPVSKLIQLYAVREIADRTRHAQPFVTINALNPGLCYTELDRNAHGATQYIIKALRFLMGWSAEEGGRTLVHGAIAGRESHGVFISNAMVVNKMLSGNVTRPDGQQTQKKIWRELASELEKIRPGITAVLTN